MPLCMFAIEHAHSYLSMLTYISLEQICYNINPYAHIHFTWTDMLKDGETEDDPKFAACRKMVDSEGINGTRTCTSTVAVTLTHSRLHTSAYIHTCLHTKTHAWGATLFFTSAKTGHGVDAAYSHVVCQGTCLHATLVSVPFQSNSAFGFLTCPLSTAQPRSKEPRCFQGYRKLRGGRPEADRGTGGNVPCKFKEAKESS